MNIKADCGVEGREELATCPVAVRTKKVVRNRMLYNYAKR